MGFWAAHNMAARVVLSRSDRRRRFRTTVVAGATPSTRYGRRTTTAGVSVLRISRWLVQPRHQFRLRSDSAAAKPNGQVSSTTRPACRAWFRNEPRLSRILKEDDVQRSMENCVGLFTCPSTWRNFSGAETGVAVSSLYCPTEIPTRCSPRSISGQSAKARGVGWLAGCAAKCPCFISRSITRRPTARRGSIAATSSRLRAVRCSRLEFVNDWRNRKSENRFRDNANLPYLPNDAFDKLLSENIVYLGLYDASASNTVVNASHVRRR